MFEEWNLEGKILLLVDGLSYLYWVYYVMFDLCGFGGELIGVFYGIINMLCCMCKEVSVEYSVCVFDVKGKMFCDDFYVDYKVNCLLMLFDFVL